MKVSLAPRAHTQQLYPARPWLPDRSTWPLPTRKGCRMFRVSSPMAPEGKRTLFFIFISTELLTSYKKHPQALTKCPRGLLPEKALPISHFIRACKGMCSTKHSRSQNVPLQENESRNIGSSSSVKSFSLEPTSSETHTQKVETVSLTDWKTSTCSH